MAQTLRIFKCTIPSCSFVMKDGRNLPFYAGVYRTPDEKEITALEEEIASGHPHIYIDPNEKEIDADMVDPVSAFKAKVIAEYLASQAAASDISNDRGSYVAPQVKPSSTQEVSTADISGTGVTQKLAMLKAK